MSKRLTPLLAGALALALAIGGCGSSDADDGSTTASKSGDEVALTKAAYIKKGNAICRRVNEDTAARYEAFFKGARKPTDEALRTAGDRIYLPNLKTWLAALSQVPAPAGQAAEVNEILDAFDAGLDKVIVKGTIPFKGTSATFVRANQLAEDYGLMFCRAS